MDAALAARLLVKPGAVLGRGAVYEPAQSQSNRPAQIPTPEFDFRGLSSQWMPMTGAENQRAHLMSDKRALSDMDGRRHARRILRDIA
jgi:hypothetical protein